MGEGNKLKQTLTVSMNQWVVEKHIKIELFTVDRCVVLQMLLYVILIKVFRWNFFDFSDGLGHVSCGENRFQPTIDKMGSAGQAHWLLKNAAWIWNLFSHWGNVLKEAPGIFGNH